MPSGESSRSCTSGGVGPAEAMKSSRPGQPVAAGASPSETTVRISGVCSMTARASSTSSGSTNSTTAPTLRASADISGAVMRKEKWVSTAPARAAAKWTTAYCGVLVLRIATREPLPMPRASSALATRLASRSASRKVMRASPDTKASLSGTRIAEKCRNSPVNMKQLSRIFRAPRPEPMRPADIASCGMRSGLWRLSAFGGEAGPPAVEPGTRGRTAAVEAQVAV